jgi:MraZ protein
MEHGVFYGTYDHKVDTQGRVSIPSRFRELLRPGIVLTQGYDRCMLIYTQQQWQSASQNVSSRPMTQSRGRLLRRMIFATAYEDTLDKQGRVLLPTRLRTYAGIEEQVVFAGVGSALELWSLNEWEQQLTLIEEQGWQVAEGLEDWR